MTAKIFQALDLTGSGSATLPETDGPSALPQRPCQRPARAGWWGPSRRPPPWCCRTWRRAQTGCGWWVRRQCGHLVCRSSPDGWPPGCGRIERRPPRIRWTRRGSGSGRRRWCGRRCPCGGAEMLWIRNFLLKLQCCGSGIPDPNFFHPGSDVFHHGSASKNLSVLTQKIVYKFSEIWSGLFIPDPGSRLFTHPVSRGQKGPGPRSGSAKLVSWVRSLEPALARFE